MSSLQSPMDIHNLNNLNPDDNWSINLWSPAPATGNNTLSALADVALGHNNHPAAATSSVDNGSSTKKRKLEQVSSSSEGDSSSSSEEEDNSSKPKTPPTPTGDNLGLSDLEMEEEDPEEDGPSEEKVQEVLNNYSGQRESWVAPLLQVLSTPALETNFDIIAKAHAEQEYLRMIEAKQQLKKSKAKKPESEESSSDSSSSDEDVRPSKKSRKEKDSKTAKKAKASSSKKSTSAKTSSKNRHKSKKASQIPLELKQRTKGLNLETRVPWTKLGHCLFRGDKWLDDQKKKKALAAVKKDKKIVAWKQQVQTIMERIQTAENSRKLTTDESSKYNNDQLKVQARIKKIYGKDLIVKSSKKEKKSKK